MFMNVEIALVVQKDQRQDLLKDIENERLVRQALMAHRQKAGLVGSIRMAWQQIIALILPS